MFYCSAAFIPIIFGRYCIMEYYKLQLRISIICLQRVTHILICMKHSSYNEPLQSYNLSYPMYFKGKLIASLINKIKSYNTRASVLRLPDSHRKPRVGSGRSDAVVFPPALLKMCMLLVSLLCTLPWPPWLVAYWQ